MASPIERLQERTVISTSEARVFTLDDADTGTVLDSLSTETRRRTYRALFEKPHTTSEVAEELDTSVQNAQYHLANLEEAGLVEPVDTVYSSKGAEMTVYAPTNDPLVFVGDESRADGVKRSLRNVVSGLGLLGIASLIVQWAAVRTADVGAATGDGIAPAGRDAMGSAATDTVAWFVFGAFEPGLLFFVVGLLVAALVVRLGD